MRCFNFLNNPNWGVFRFKESDWGDSRLEDIAAVLENVKQVFEKHFGFEYINQFEIAIIYSDDEFPEMYLHPSVIKLTVCNSRWNQFIYQFAHELCHMMIQNKSNLTIRWFEECICEVASQFFLLELSETWNSSPPYECLRDYSSRLYDYFIGAQKKIYDTNIPFNVLIKEKIDWLISHPGEDRKMNTLCANKILPYFLETPTLWKDIILLNKIPIGLSFAGSLKVWETISANPDKIKAIISLLIPE